MKIDDEVMDDLASSMTPYDVAELLGMVPDEHRRWALNSLQANPPSDVDPVEAAVSAYLSLTAPEVKRLRKRIRELTNETL